MSDGELPAGLAAVIERARPLTERFVAAGHRIYFVGGVVRDQLLSRERGAQDLDVTTDARPAEIKSLLRGLAQSVWTQGERFGTIGCMIDGQIYEITTHRAEAYDEGSRKPVVVFGDAIEDDLARRDFTVNAMAVDLETGGLVDPHRGRADLAAGVLRTPLDPEVSFSEDPLRMLRAARFRAGYGLVLEERVAAAIESMAERIEIVSGERIRDELQKLILLDDVRTGLVLLAQTGLLAHAVPLLAGLDTSSAGLVGGQVSAVPPDPAMRWAALLGPSDVGPADLRALRFSGAMSRDVLWFVSARDWVDRPGSRSVDAPALRRAAALVPADRDLIELVDWVEALRVETGQATDDLTLHRAALARLVAEEPDVADPAALLTGEAVCALLGIAPGRDVGVAMAWLRDLRLEEGPTSPEHAAARLLAWWATRPDRG